MSKPLKESIKSPSKEEKKTPAAIRDEMLAELERLKNTVAEEKDFIPVSVEKEKIAPKGLQSQILKELNRLQDDLLRQTEYTSSETDEYADSDQSAKTESEQLYNLMNIRNNFIADLNKIKTISESGIMEVQKPADKTVKPEEKDSPWTKLLSGIRKAFKTKK